MKSNIIHKKRDQTFVTSVNKINRTFANSQLTSVLHFFRSFLLFSTYLQCATSIHSVLYVFANYFQTANKIHLRGNIQDILCK